MKEIYLTKNLYKFLYLRMKFFRFYVAMVTLDRYFKRKDSLPNPNGNLLLNITPGVITAMNREVTSTLLESGNSGQVTTKKRQPYNR